MFLILQMLLLVADTLATANEFSHLNLTEADWAQLSPLLNLPDNFSDTNDNATSATQSDLHTRIINGENAPPNHFPWAVSIKGVFPKSKATTYCGATIISSQWLITAAHCFIGKTADGTTMQNPIYWHVQAGNVNIELGAGHSHNQKIIRKHGIQNVGNGDQQNNGLARILQMLQALLNGQPLQSFLQTGGSRKTGPILHAHLDQIIVHPKYHSSDLEWDIALLRLKYPLNFHTMRHVAPIQMPPLSIKSLDWPRDGEVCVLVGWGCTKNGGGPSTRAQLAHLKVVGHDACSQMYEHNAGLNRQHEFCAGYYKGNIGICPGDSGSGLVCKRQDTWFVTGVASATHANKPGSYPGLFTRISHFRKWIDEVTGNGHH